VDAFFKLIHPIAVYKFDKHCEKNWFRTTHVVFETQQVGPVKPCPPHKLYSGAH
jgi:hypothetical protein